jgi:hypothetical protein
MGSNILNMPEQAIGRTYSVDELVERRVMGWKGEDFVFLSMLGNLSVLNQYPKIEKNRHYHGLHGCSVIVVASRSTANDGYEEVEKLLTAGVANLGFWMLELPRIAELALYGNRYANPMNLFLDQEWAQQVRQISQALAV